MPFNQILKIAYVSLKTNKTRSALTMLGIIIGVASVILLVSLGNGLQKYITGQLEGIGSNLVMILPGKMDLNKMGGGGGGSGASFLNSKLEIQDIKVLESNSSLIKAAIPFIIAQSAVKYNEEKMYAEIEGTSANFYQVVNSPLSLGDYFTEADERSARKVAILGSEIANTLFKEEDPIDQKVTVGESKYTVVGVLKSKGIGGQNMEDHVIIPISTASRVYNKDKLSAIYAQVVSPDKVDLAIEEAKLALSSRLNDDDYTILTQKEILGAVSSILNMLTLALTGIAAISLLVGGIGIMNIMLVSVTERTKEIGLRKALGATPSVILVQFLTEAIILSVGGGLIGILIGAGGSLLLNQAITTEVTPGSVLLAFGVSLIVGVIFGVAPARRASKLSPIEALRYE